ncbi:MAG: hypothetical protein ACK5O2_09535, partial [Microthrixaceae bacterium]
VMLDVGELSTHEFERGRDLDAAFDGEMSHDRWYPVGVVGQVQALAATDLSAWGLLPAPWAGLGYPPRLSIASATPIGDSPMATLRFERS